MHRPLLALFGLAWSGLAVACYQPSAHDGCGLVCGGGGACPEGYGCRGDGYCHPVGSSLDCASGGDAGCTQGDRRCGEQGPEECQAGVWIAAAACTAPTPACSDGLCVARSCVGVAATCGAEGDLDCCAAYLISGFHYPMGRSTAGTDAFAAGLAQEVPEHDVTVADFRMDAFEVTVGRFRTFLATYDGTPPAEGAGAHPLIAGSGWQAAWNTSLLPSRAEVSAALACGPEATWTDAPGGNENKPLNCVTWYELTAFCIWDGGRLPTEAEWEYAAVGPPNRLYPWGQDAPDATRADYGCQVAEPASECTAADIAPVGSFPAGATDRGIRDLAGSMWEWTLDLYSDVWYGGGGNTCVNCANLDMPTTQGHTIRGGGWNFGPDDQRSVRRDSVIASWRGPEISARCVR